MIENEYEEKRPSPKWRAVNFHPPNLAFQTNIQHYTSQILDTMARNKKRSQRQPSPQPPRQDIKHDWKKGDEELELEEALFGRKQKKFKPDNNNDEESGMSEVEDNDVRLCFCAIITSNFKVLMWIVVVYC